MNPRQEISRLLSEWLELGRREGAAIKASDWLKLSEVQKLKEQLKTPLAQAKINFLRTAEVENLEAAFPMEMGRLISLANRNAAMLSRQMNMAAAARETMEQAHRNLRKIQSSYAPRRPAAGLSFYS